MRLGVILPSTTPDGSAFTWATLIAVSVAATATARIEVGTCILQVPLRRPVELALHPRGSG